MTRQTFLTNLITHFFITAYAGFMFMFLLPLAHEVLNTPDRNPSFLKSWLLVIVFNGVLSLFRHNNNPKTAETAEKKLIY